MLRRPLRMHICVSARNVFLTAINRDLQGYLKHIMSSTNMACLTPEGAMSGDCDFLSANLYARSLFGEDALANLSIEKMETGSISGHVRIRSKTQGIALSLGDRITLGTSVPLPTHLLQMSSSPFIWQLKKRTRHLYRYNTYCFHFACCCWTVC